MYFSEELYNAEKYGYNYEIKSGYLFEKFNVFDDYISEIYKIKESSHKSDSWYTISKLLLNSLYGRFGMNPQFLNYAFIKSDEIDDYQDKYNVHNIITLNEYSDILFISYEEKNTDNSIYFSKLNNNVSI